MSAMQFNISLGREVEFYQRVDTNDPGTSRLGIAILALAGLESDDVLRDKETVSAVLAGTTNEVTNAGYSRKVYTDADLSALTVDHTLNRYLLTLPSHSFGSPNIAAGDQWAKALIYYDPVAGADSTLIPISLHDTLKDGVVITPPGGSPIVVDFSAGFMIARQF